MASTQYLWTYFYRPMHRNCAGRDTFDSLMEAGMLKLSVIAIPLLMIGCASAGDKADYRKAQIGIVDAQMIAARGSLWSAHRPRHSGRRLWRL